MNEQEIIEIARQSLLTVIIVSGPIMAVSMVVGLAVSLFQALTQIQEQTLTFVPKIIAMFVALVFLAPFMMHHMVTFTEGIMDKIVGVGTGSE
ncbi:flagellar biosynthesis protein FliQ [Nitrospirillum sp. BR 11163]|uniref:flagellar biosynthesis protein FliQ n=1 Tax=Nitrospirillum sp. BR 11163 TaxID=3104323 RepID=UPI002B0016D1|nr:flagellar biosynthesis protein FliQ [Nitrospirillum sp. BR 11163]MEA1676082.1 flagellar biosynthesis protein FliQ [Nitrospirillum sp. BR 11163]